MKKKLLAGLATGLFLLVMGGVAQAELVTIGTATYQTSGTNTAVNPGSGNDQYKLIYDTDLQITWLDYSAPYAIWGDYVTGLGGQDEWANTLGGSLTVNMNSGYSTSNDWATGWRLPETVNGPYVYGTNGTTTGGYNITSSEMGHLYYTELGNLGYRDTSGNVQSGYGLNNTGDFDNLIASWYWSGTEYATDPATAWHFGMRGGDQHNRNKGNSYEYGLAVRSGQVSAVPVPGAIWMLGSGLISLVTLSRRKKGNRG